VAFTNTALEFSTRNKSYHPVLGALPQTNTVTTSGSVQLAAARLNSGWVAGRTMSCTDCHNATAAEAGAQGPHGSAYKFMLAGTNKQWPFQSNGTTLWGLDNYTTSQGTANGIFCLNCHTISGNQVHGGLISGGQHSGWSAGPKVCVGCHISVPHGGKVARLIATAASVASPTSAWSTASPALTNVPAAYQVAAATVHPIVRISRPTTSGARPTWQATCNSQHTGAGDSW
jgi:hypothetical protein